MRQKQTGRSSERIIKDIKRKARGNHLKRSNLKPSNGWTGLITNEY